MCGISGTTYKSVDFSNSVSCISHRGPDNSGYFADDSVSLYHHRLSIIDIDGRANQPLSDKSGKFIIVFNGEIYNFKELRQTLESEYSFSTTSDTEVLVYLYMKHGKRMLEMLNGMYAICIYDKEDNKLFLARDSSGIKPLFYCLQNGHITFSSEIKGVASMLNQVGVTLSLDRQSVVLFGALGYIPAPRTLVAEIRSIEKGSWIEFDISAGTATRGEQLLYNEPLTQPLREVLESAVADHLISDVPVGLLFSGGTDSSIIASILNEKKVSLSTWSISFNGDTLDNKYINLIREELNLDSRVYKFGPKEFDSVYEYVMSKIDEPTYDNSLFPTYYIAKQASAEVKVVLSGEGGDEYFLGYERMKAIAKMAKTDRKITIIERIFFLLPSFKGKNKVFQILYAALGMPYAYYLITMSPSKDMMSLESWTAAKRALAAIERPIDIDSAMYLEGDLLRKTDMATSYASIEGRVPLLDRRVIRFAKDAGIQAHLQGGTKSLLKGALAEFLPKEIVYRKKTGFGMDLRSYFMESKFLKKDLEESLRFLINRDIKLAKKFSLGSLDYYINRYPNYCLALITLSRSMKNLHL
jgi:asparagine synthase (glutamine-hydrolysing)